MGNLIQSVTLQYLEGDEAARFVLADLFRDKGKEDMADAIVTESAVVVQRRWRGQAGRLETFVQFGSFRVARSPCYIPFLKKGSCQTS